MVKYNFNRLDGIFSALGDPTRRAILARLSQGEASVSELARPFRMSLPAISKHLGVLERAGLLKRKISGRVHRIQLLASPLREATKWMEAYRECWEGQLDFLENYLENINESFETL